ncbi:hypothetical protein [Rubrobacter aplysinae]|uniref:hypothetical protein n=1 Tax=Rubrobacter aplysinae TaxID=909625 RepID=UPI00128D05D4|nr:hypothetical protein [Rubrobacter aplysinae]
MSEAYKEPVESVEEGAGDHASVVVLGGDAFELLERLQGWRRPPVYANVDLTSGISSEAPGLRFLSWHVESVTPTRRRIIELARKVSSLLAPGVSCVSTSDRGLCGFCRYCGYRGYEYYESRG